MKTAKLKSELHEKIDHANQKQLEQLYGLVLNYFGSQIVIGDDADALTDVQQKLIDKGFEQAQNGLGASFDSVTERIKRKHGFLIRGKVLINCCL